MERSSISVEGTLSQGLHRGPAFEQLGVVSDATGGASQVLGDIHWFAALFGVETSLYPTRRLGIGLRAGGGVTTIEVGRDREGTLPTITGGPTVEYYTKLSHFSVGADVDAIFAFGFDRSVNASAYVKYTF